MSFNKFVEDQIQKGMSEGFFDNLPGKGQPLNFDEYFNTPEDLRLGYSVLKSNHIIPPEVELLREIGELKEQLAACQDEAKRKELARTISDKQMFFNMTIERYRRKR